MHEHHKTSWQIKIGIIPIVAAIHLIVFAALVQIFSLVFFDHTYYFLKVLAFTIGDKLYLTIAIYFLICLVVDVYQKSVATKADNYSLKLAEYKTKFVVKKGDVSSWVMANEIVYLMAESPYVAIHSSKGKFLISDTLKSLEDQLHPEEFIRIHKSVIVRLDQISGIKSRANGDYDVLLKNCEEVRMSRNYSQNLKNKLTLQQN